MQSNLHDSLGSFQSWESRNRKAIYIIMNTNNNFIFLRVNNITKLQ